MKKTDLKIIKELRKDSRISLTKMSEKLDIPITTLFYRLKFCQKNLIKKNTIELNYRELGYNARIAFAIRVKKEDRQELKSFLLECPFVNSLYGEKYWDFFVELIFKHDSDGYEFLNIVEQKFSVEKYDLIHIIDNLKHEKMIS